MAVVNVSPDLAVVIGTGVGGSPSPGFVPRVQSDGITIDWSSSAMLYGTDFGMVGDCNNTTGTDNAAAFTACVQALPASGGTIMLAPGAYFFASGIDFALLGRNAGIRIVGAGQGGGYSSGDTATSNATSLVFASGIGDACLYFGKGIISNQTHGPVFEHITVQEVADGHTNTLVHIRKCESWLFYDCTIRGGLVNVEIDSDNSAFGGGSVGGDASWGTAVHSRFARGITNFYVPFSSGFTLLGCSFFGINAVTTNNLLILGGAAQRIIGCKFDNGVNCINTQGTATIVNGCGFEAFTGVGVLLDGNANSTDGKNHRVIGCYFTPTGAVGATNIQVTSAATDAQLLGNSFASVTATHVTDAGVRTRRFDQDGLMLAAQTFTPATSATTLTTDLDTAVFDLTGASGSGLTGKLPTVAGASIANKELRIVKIDNAHTLTVTGNGGETINGAANFTIVGQYGARTVRCDGTNWTIISSNGIA